MRGLKILILHGWGSNSERWQRVKELLGEKGIEVLVLDLPGFGIIPSPPKPWGREDYIDWIFQKVKEKNWEKFNLLGHSFGGGLAVKMATNFSEKIDRLILCAPAIIKRKSIKTYLFYWLAFLGRRIFSLPGLKTFYPQAQKLVYKLAGARDYYVADGIMKETMKKIGKEEDLEMVLERIKTPTLILWGKKDDVLPLKDAYRIKEKIKRSQLRVLPGARHSPHREAPEELSKILVSFLQS
ncbi:MAG: alpha/beta hydrolase [Candidatus Nealsonbacteria bacterium]|nr:MAG: alpha/beta hydrolase [Candidatus Nealsonbacteria bacterium]